MGLESQNIFTTESSTEEISNSVFKIPNIKLLRAITKTKLQAEHYLSVENPSSADFQYFGVLVASLLDMSIQFEDLSHALDLALYFANRVRKKYPDLVSPLIEKALDVYRTANHPQPVATRLAYSRLKMYLAQFLLEQMNINLADIRKTVFHCHPIINELNFIIVLLKAKNYLKASGFLQELEPLFQGLIGQIDEKITLPYYELKCLANLGVKQFGTALDALDKGYQLAQQLPRTSFQASRYIAVFEKIIAHFDSNKDKISKNFSVENFIIPGVIFDKMLLHSSVCDDSEGTLVEF